MNHPPTDPLITRIQQSLRATAQAHFRAWDEGVATVYLNPHDVAPHQNYAIPNDAAPADPAALARIADAFQGRYRRPRFEFIREAAPQWPAALEALGYAETLCAPLLICNAAMLSQPALPAALTLCGHPADADDATLRTVLQINEQGFGGAADAAFSDDDLERCRLLLGAGRAWLACWAGRPVACGMFSEPRDGLCELAGITTLPGYRGRGIATALTAAMAYDALHLGADLVFLTADDAAAMRIYQRVGFAQRATLVSYVISADQPWAAWGGG